MAKGKHTLANSTSHEDPNLEDDYHNLFADNTDLEDKEDDVDLDGIANLDGSEMDGVEFDGSYFDGADLDGVYLDGTKRDGANLAVLDVDVPKCSNSRRGMNMSPRQNKRLKTKKGRIGCNTMKWVLASFLGVLARTSVSNLPPKT